MRATWPRDRRVLLFPRTLASGNAFRTDTRLRVLVIDAFERGLERWRKNKREREREGRMERSGDKKESSSRKRKKKRER